jgi:hypothetical protein
MSRSEYLIPINILIPFVDTCISDLLWCHTHVSCRSIRQDIAPAYTSMYGTEALTISQAPLAQRYERHPRIHRMLVRVQAADLVGLLLTFGQVCTALAYQVLRRNATVSPLAIVTNLSTMMGIRGLILWMWRGLPSATLSPTSLVLGAVLLRSWPKSLAIPRCNPQLNLQFMPLLDVL